MSENAPVDASSEGARPSLLDQLRGLDDRFWIVNIMEMFERLAYYGVRAVVAIYMVLALEAGGPQFDHVQKGAIFAAWAAMQSVLPMFTGGFADRYGHKRTIAVAIVIKIIGYAMMASFKSYPLFFAGCMFLAAGTAIFKPGVQGTLAATLKRSNASVGWGIFYQLVNVGGFLGPVLAGVLRILDWSYVFWACAIIVSINFLWLPFYKDPTQEMEDKDLAAAEARLREGWGVISRAVPVSLARGWATAFSLVVAAWFAILYGGAWLFGELPDQGVPVVDGLGATSPDPWQMGMVPSMFLAIGLLGALPALGATILAWAGRHASIGGGVLLLLLAGIATLSFADITPLAEALLVTANPRLGSFANTLGYLAWTGGIIGPALLFFVGDKAAFDKGRTDPFGIYVASVSGLFQHRVLFFCLVFSGFWLMFNQVFDLLPNVIDDWVDSSGLILSIGKAFSTPLVPGLVALLLGLVYGAICASGVLLSMRPDRRPAAQVSTPATVVESLALAGALWPVTTVLLGLLSPQSTHYALADLAIRAELGSYRMLFGILALPLSLLLALPLSFGGRALRAPAKLLAIVSGLVGTAGAFGILHGTFSQSAETLVAMARDNAQVNPEWMINLNPGLIVFTMIFFAWLSSFVRPLTSIMIGMAVATAGAVLAGTATLGWICLGGILVFSVGEMLSSPKKMEYLATLAPKGQEGLFMGYANIPVAIGWISGSIFAGSRYEEAGDKVNLARQHLVDELGVPVEQVAQLQKTDVMPLLAEKLGSSIPEAQRLLFETYHPEQIWVDIGLIGLVSIVGMVIYDRVLRVVDRRRAAVPAD